MSYEFYKVLHLIGVFITIASLAGMSLHMASGGTREYSNRKFAGMFHGIGLTITLIAGFGLLARLGMHNGIPGWAIAKLVVWVILGGMPALIYRKPNLAKQFWAFILLFASLNAYLAIYKPF
jgi:uncharacterized membrane protein SirB2